MWHPASWRDLEALLGATETHSLDFKREIGSNEELAKDIAAMTVDGGVLVYGVDEDKETCVATDIVPFAIAGVEEKLQQVAGTRVSPQPDIQVHAVGSPDDPALGCAVVVIAPSGLAPHQANKRFPYRRGTTTDYLEEREIERLYRQRQDLSRTPAAADELIDAGFATVFDGFEIPDGVGVVQLVVRPAASDSGHPAGAWQGPVLLEASRSAVQRQGPRMGNSTLVRSFSDLSGWQALGVDGWWASNTDIRVKRTAPDIAPNMLIGACLTYPATLSFHHLLGLKHVRSPGSTELRSAREVDLTYEVVGQLAISGEYFSEVPGGGHLLVALRLARFDGARSQMTIGSSNVGDLEAMKLAGAPSTITQATRTSAAQLREAPEEIARVLIERWLPAFYVDDRNLFRWVIPPE
ncbi:MAG: ATP-binding protein [Solirubrobacteraceae bacterium]|jgi:hypothetical protein